MSAPPFLVDTHSHLGHIERGTGDVLREAEEVGVGIVVDIGMGTDGSREAVERAAAYPGRVFAAAGLHPNDLDEFDRDRTEAMAGIRALVGHPEVVGVGETGLDRYRERAAPELQEDAFRAHIGLAKEVGKPLIIHCRDAHARVLEILDETGSPAGVIMHCFSGDAAYARACVQRGFFCSFAGNLTYKRSEELREAARAVPDELVLVETDAPFLAPHPFRGKPNAPALVVHTARTLADVRGTDEPRMLELLTENARKVFGLF